MPPHSPSTSPSTSLTDSRLLLLTDRPTSSPGRLISSRDRLTDNRELRCLRRSILSRDRPLRDRISSPRAHLPTRESRLHRERRTPRPLPTPPSVFPTGRILRGNPISIILIVKQKQSTDKRGPDFVPVLFYSLFIKFDSAYRICTFSGSKATNALSPTS